MLVLLLLFNLARDKRKASANIRLLHDELMLLSRGLKLVLGGDIKPPLAKAAVLGLGVSWTYVDELGERSCWLLQAGGEQSE